MLRTSITAALAVSLLLPLGCREATDETARGRELFGYCVQCHGDTGGGNQAFVAPPIAGLPAWYLEAELQKFRIGARGAHPQDVEGLRMRPMSRVLATNDEVRIVSQHVAAMAVVPQPQTLENASAEAGRGHYATCVQCHGDRAQGLQNMNAPPLAQSADWYLVAQLGKFRSGIRGTNRMDSSGGQMRPMAMTLPDDQAVRDVVAYIVALRTQGDAPSAPVAQAQAQER